MNSEAKTITTNLDSKSECLEKLASIASQVSIDKLQVASKNRLSLQLVDFEKERETVYSKWLAMILLCGPHLEVTFKVHYSTEVGRSFLAKATKRTVDEVVFEKVQDFFREYCNTFGGGFKAVLDSQNIVIGLSLPLSIRGSDEILFSRRKDYEKNVRFWKLKADDAEIICSFHVEILNENELVDLSVPKEPIKTKKRKIAFL